MGSSRRPITWSHNLGSIENVLPQAAPRRRCELPDCRALFRAVGRQPIGCHRPVMGDFTQRIRITWIKSASVTDTSNASFVIQ